jgi:hypothetical protein
VYSSGAPAEALEPRHLVGLEACRRPRSYTKPQCPRGPDLRMGTPCSRLRSLLLGVALVEANSMGAPDLTLHSTRYKTGF